MGFAADLAVGSTDPEVSQLKPDPKGLLYVIYQLGLSVEDCLFIGDRQEVGGGCALRANMACLTIDKKSFNQFDFYAKLIDDITFKTQVYETQPLTS